MIKFYSGSQHILTSSMDFNGDIPSEIMSLLAYDAEIYTSAHSGILGTPLLIPVMNSKRITLHGKNGFNKYTGMTLYIHHLKPNFRFDLLHNWLKAVPISIFDDRTISSHITLGDYKL